MIPDLARSTRSVISPVLIFDVPAALFDGGEDLIDQPILERPGDRLVGAHEQTPETFLTDHQN